MARRRQPKSTLELALDELRVANLRMKLWGQVGDMADQKSQLLAELIHVQNMVSEVIDEVRARSV